MNRHHSSSEIFESRRRRLLGTIAFAAIALLTGSGPARGQTGEHMQQFVLLFRSGPAALSDIDQRNRARDIRAWAERQNAEGHRLDPRQLEARARLIGPLGKPRPVVEMDTERPLANILFLQALDFEEAVRIAETHPGLRYGATVEVRAWKSPIPLQQQAEARD